MPMVRQLWRAAGSLSLWFFTLVSSAAMYSTG